MMEDQFHWIEPGAMQALLYKLKGSLLKQSLRTYFALGLDCSFPVLASIVLHWPSPLEGDERTGKTLQIELWHTIRHQLAHRALSAGWNLVRADTYLEVDDIATLDQCILDEVQIDMSPGFNRLDCELRLPGTRPWDPEVEASLLRATRHIGGLSLVRRRNPQTFNLRHTSQIETRRDCRTKIDHVTLTVTMYQAEIKAMLERFWIYCLECIDLPPPSPLSEVRLEQYARTLRNEMIATAYRRLLGDREPQTGLCANCRTRWMDMLQCSVCKVIKYCSDTCQRADWSKHRTECRKFEK
jgi:hypothetical protein